MCELQACALCVCVCVCVCVCMCACMRTCVLVTGLTWQNRSLGPKWTKTTSVHESPPWNHTVYTGTSTPRRQLSGAECLPVRGGRHPHPRWCNYNHPLMKPYKSRCTTFHSGQSQASTSAWLFSSTLSAHSPMQPPLTTPPTGGMQNWASVEWCNRQTFSHINTSVFPNVSQSSPAHTTHHASAPAHHRGTPASIHEYVCRFVQYVKHYRRQQYRSLLCFFLRRGVYTCMY